GEETVRLLAVIPQRLAMVRSENEKRRPPRGPKVLEEGAECLVDPRHLAQVRLGRERGRGGLWRNVRGRAVRKEKKEKAPPAAIVCPPAASQRDHFRGGALRHAEVVVVRALGILLVVDVETSIETEARVERKGPDRGAGRVARRVEEGGERRG